MTRYVVGAIVLCFLGYFGYSWHERSVEADNKKEAQSARHQALKSSVSDMALKVNAVTNWAEQLAGDNLHRATPVFTAELQKLWLIDRPILVIGNVGDVSLNGDGSYQVIVVFDDPRSLLAATTIRVSLRCDEAIAITLIQAVKDKKKNHYGADVAIAGVIERVVSGSERVLTDGESGIEEDTTKVLTGVGRCKDAMPLPERISW